MPSKRTLQLPHRLATLGLAAALLACGEPPRDPLRRDPVPDGPGTAAVRVRPRTPEVATYPCYEQCHSERTPSAEPRALTFHTSIAVRHAPVMTWCTSCHLVDDPNRFRLIDGTTVAFDEADRLCGQCHGEKHRSWSRGVHGIQTGSWTGVAERRSCTACHDPHEPGGISFEALPPPRAVTG